MKEIIDCIKTKTKLRIFGGVSLVLLGLILYLVPLVPSAWAIFLGLELLGIRILANKKFGEYLKANGFGKKEEKPLE